MKGLGMFIAALVFFALWFKAKDQERSRVSAATYEYVIKICNDNTECVVRTRDHFSGCFDLAYYGGVMPGAGTVELKAFAQCFNWNMGTMNLVVASSREGRAPFPTR